MPDHVQPTVDVPALLAVLDGPYAGIRELTRKHLVEHAQILDDQIGLDTDAFRDRVLEVVKEMAATGSLGVGFPTQYGGGGDIGASVAGFETMALGDLSVLVKVGVHFGLFGGAILHLGSQEHHDAYLADLVTADLLGCFAMTESGHGSNVQALGTTATYDADAGEFVITTPDQASRKDYIGNAARHADMAVVFAQLEIGGESEGVHAFVVPIRDARGNPLPGVTIEDDGPKLGLNGVDNGRLSFDAVRVPRANLLNRYADVSEDGTYSSPIDNRGRRFFTMLGTLVQGRVCVGGAGINAAKVALTIAVKYALFRRQFGEPGSGERSCSSTTGCTSVGCSRCWRAPTRCTSPRRCWRWSCTRCSPARRSPGTRRPNAGAVPWSPGPRAPRRSAPGTPPAPSRSAARRVAAPATSPSTGSPRSRRTPTCSPRSRATTTC